MATDAIHWLTQLNDIDPELPFFLYYVPGGTHAPHHPTPEWVQKITDMHLFDKGWNALRDQIFANQKRLGVIPQDAKLTPWPDDLLQRWEQTTDEEKKLFIRQAEVYAAYLAYTDHEIRAGDPGGRRPRQARRHAHHLHQRRQRRVRRGFAEGHAERGAAVQRC
jgi:arylsulfatase